jgi:L-alanine-DL-glutamate epimerase-like enolase superfamily enzyme
MALWDIKGKAVGASVASLLGGPFRQRLPLYVSGLRAGTREARAALAERCFAEGFSAVKLFLGKGLQEDLAEARAVREKVGDGKTILCDLFWGYTLPEAERIGRAFEELAIEWIEAPLAPEDVRGHAKLAEALQVAIAVGEPLRTRYQFLDWFERRALDIAQPDVARCGVTEGKLWNTSPRSLNFPHASSRTR